MWVNLTYQGYESDWVEIFLQMLVG